MLLLSFDECCEGRLLGKALGRSGSDSSFFTACSGKRKSHSENWCTGGGDHSSDCPRPRMLFLTGRRHLNAWLDFSLGTV